jgi:hypothetical protein
VKLCPVYAGIRPWFTKSKTMKTYLSILVLVLSSVLTQAQVAQMLFYGYIEEGIFDDGAIQSKKKKAVEAKKLEETKIFVYLNDSLYRTVDSRKTGFYALLLDAGNKYHVVFEKEGYFCKCFEMDCRALEYSSDEGAMKCLTDVSLFKKVDDADLLSLCKVPYAKCKFSTETQAMVWDLEYTEKAKNKFYELAEPYYLAQKK